MGDVAEGGFFVLWGLRWHGGYADWNRKLSENSKESRLKKGGPVVRYQ
jgi:hypothetical protein